MRYTVSNIKGNPSAYGKLSADLLEEGIAIAKVTRPAQTGGYIGDLSFKFYTDASKGRFVDWCDSISMSEGFEALTSTHRSEQN
jgi:hypothetical protein